MFHSSVLIFQREPGGTERKNTKAKKGQKSPKKSKKVQKRPKKAKKGKKKAKRGKKRQKEAKKGGWIIVKRQKTAPHKENKPCIPYGIHRTTKSGFINFELKSKETLKIPWYLTKELSENEKVLCGMATGDRALWHRGQVFRWNPGFAVYEHIPKARKKGNPKERGGGYISAKVGHSLPPVVKTAQNRLYSP